MKVLVVYAHANPESFCHAILEALSRGLKDGGHMVEVDDLYGIGFDPRLKLEGFTEFTEGQMSKDVLEQQEKVAQADALAFIYPTVWYGFPAILKGWLDRVLSDGFAYTNLKATGEADGLLRHKKALVISTTMFEEAFYEASGIGDAMKRIVDASLKEMCGIKQVEQIFLCGPGEVDAEARKGYLELAYRLDKEF